MEATLDVPLMPPPVPTTAVYSKADGIVNRRRWRNLFYPHTAEE